MIRFIIFLILIVGFSIGQPIEGFSEGRGLTSISPKDNLDIEIGIGRWKPFPSYKLASDLFREGFPSIKYPYFNEWTIRWFISPKIQIGFCRGNFWIERASHIDISWPDKEIIKEVSFEGNYNIALIGYMIEKWDILVGGGLGIYNVLLTKEETPVDGSKGTAITRIDGDTWGGEVFVEREYKVNESIGIIGKVSYVIAKVSDLEQLGEGTPKPSDIYLSGIRGQCGLRFHF